VSVASVALHNPKLSAVIAEDHAVVLRLLSDRRDDVVAQRIRTINRLHVLLRDLEPGGPHSCRRSPRPRSSPPSVR
jgi:hypothetical protein